jgi:signal peptidase I
MIVAKKISKVVYYLFLAGITVLALLLAVAVLPIPGNYRVLTVLSGSMEPVIHTGSVVIVVPRKDYKIGEVVTFGGNGAMNIPTTHRIKDVQIAGGKYFYVTKGDANNTEDENKVAQSEIKGSVLISIPYLGFAVNFIKQPIGFLLVIAIPAVLIILEEVKKIRKEVKRKQENNNINYKDKLKEN